MDYRTSRIKYIGDGIQLLVGREIEVSVKIETKYNIGQEVWFVDNFKPNSGIIIRIDISVFEDKGYIPRYIIRYNGGIAREFENNVYRTKKWLLNSL